MALLCSRSASTTTPAAARQRTRDALRTSRCCVLCSPRPRCADIALISFAYAAVQMCFTSYLVVFLTERAGLTLVTAGAVFSAAMIAGIVGRILWGAVADYRRQRAQSAGSLGLLMAACALAITQVSRRGRMRA